MKLSRVTSIDSNVDETFSRHSSEGCQSGSENRIEVWPETDQMIRNGRKTVGLLGVKSSGTPKKAPPKELRRSNKAIGRVFYERIEGNKGVFEDGLRYNIACTIALVMKARKIGLKFAELRGDLKETPTAEFKWQLVRLAHELARIKIALKRTKQTLYLAPYKKGDLSTWKNYSTKEKPITLSFEQVLEYIANFQIPATVQRYRTNGSQKSISALNGHDLAKLEDLNVRGVICEDLENMLQPKIDSKNGRSSETIVIVCGKTQRPAKVEDGLLQPISDEGEDWLIN